MFVPRRLLPLGCLCLALGGASTARAQGIETGLPIAQTFERTAQEPLGLGWPLRGVSGWRTAAGGADTALMSAPLGHTAAALSPESSVIFDVESAEMAPVVWLEMTFLTRGFVSPQTPPASEASSAVVLFDRTSGIVCLDGDGLGGGTLEVAGVPLDGTTWHQMILRLDFAQQRWDCHVDGALLLANLGFRDAVTSLSGFALGSGNDAFQIGQVSIEPASSLVARGDVDLSGVIDAADLVLLVNGTHGTPMPTLGHFLRADMTEDNRLTGEDVTSLVQWLLGNAYP